MTAMKDMVTAQRERSRAQIARYHEIRAALETIRISASSTDRSVTVDMAAGGAIVDLRLTPQAMAKTPDTLAATILEAIRLGLAEVAHRTAAEVEPLTGRRVDVAAITQGRLPALDAATASPESPAPAGDRDPVSRAAQESPAVPAPSASAHFDAVPAPVSGGAAADPRFPAEEE